MSHPDSRDEWGHNHTSADVWLIVSHRPSRPLTRAQKPTQHGATARRGEGRRGRVSAPSSISDSRCLVESVDGEKYWTRRYVNVSSTPNSTK